MQSAILPSMWRLRLFLLVLVLGLPKGNGFAAADGAGAVVDQGLDAGAPLVRRFSSADLGTHPGILDVLADPSGVVFAGNIEGLLRYTGGRFELLALPGAAPARALALGRDGRIYVASYDHFGVLESGMTGDLAYRDLRPAFALADRKAFLGGVWSVHALDDAVYFHADGRLYRYGYDGGTAVFSLPPQTRAFHDDGRRLYTRVESEGVKRFSDGQLLAQPGGELFADRPLDLLIPGPEGELILLSREGGFFRADDAGLEPLPNPFSGLFGRHVPYAFARLHDGSLAIGTLSGELLLFSPGLEPLQRYRLGIYPVRGLSVDAEHGLWVATEGGLLRLQLPSPWTAIPAEEGLPGQVMATALHGDRLWIAGSRGLVFSNATALGETGLQGHPGADRELWDLAATPAGLLAAGPRGLHLVESHGLTLLDALEEPYLLVKAEDTPNRIYAAGEHAVWLLEVASRGVEVLQEIRIDSLGVSSIQPLAPDEIWVGDYRGGPWRLRLSEDGRQLLERRQCGQADGLDLDPEHGSVVFRLDGRLHVLTGRRVLIWDGRRFLPSPDDGLAALIDRPGEAQILETPHGTYLLNSRHLYRRPSPGMPWEPVRIDSPLAHGFSGMRLDSDGVLRLVTWNGVLQYRHGIALPPLPPLRVALRRVEAIDSANGGQRLPLLPDVPPRLAPGASLRFRFEALTSDAQPCFQTRLIGVERRWSPCSTDAERLFLGLPHGNYRFELRAQTAGGRSSNVLGYDFEVSPRWHEALPSRIALAALALLLLLAFASALARQRHRRLAQANRELEARIAERTVALEEANRRLSQLATEDSLTGVANHRALDQGLAREWLRCADRGLSLAVLMMDVDHFKAYNDRHGHLDGDRVLRRLAEHLGDRIDDQRELLARYGGEEFVLVIPDCSLEQARSRAESLRQSVDGPQFPLTLSIGVAAEVPDPASAPSQLVRRADIALYRAKQAGRNRVEVAE
jgi:diguanylate cyclase (GGDEF)-like protein